MRAVLICGLLLISACAHQSFAQDGESPAASDPLEQVTEAPEAPEKVDVQPLARDEEISSRLLEILTATEWFEKPGAEVKDGVVFLKGEASEEKYRSWASDLARNTQDVAAVVNRMTVTKKSMWDMSPAIAETRALVANAIQTLPLILFATVVIAFTVFLAGVARWCTAWVFRKRISNNLLRSVVAQAAMIPVLLIGIYLVLRISGLTQLALTVLGGTGIAGLIIGIAFRDIAENFLASILISVQNPFRSGDLIEVGEHVGFVQRVSTRGTLLMTHDGNHVQIPNSQIYKSTVTNFSANPNRRVQFTIGIGYDDSVTKAQEVIKRVLNQHPSVLAEPKSRVILDQLGASTVNLRVDVWLDALKHSADSVRSSVMRLVKQSLFHEGISMPDEAREVIFPNNVPVQMIEASTASEPADTANADRVHSAAAKERDDEPEEIVSAGEGSLQSDAHEIQRQADKSWSPEEGTNLLATGT